MNLLALRKRQWRAALFLGLSYLALMWISETYIPHPATLFPASAVALSVLFLEGIELWPVVLIASFVGSLLVVTPILFVFISPIAQTLQAIFGAYLLRQAKIDPLFRRSRDIFWLITIVLIVSLIVPSIVSLTNLASIATVGHSYPLAAWYLRYTGNVLCLLIIIPFLLRWIAKVRFSRTLLEIAETLAVFGILTFLGIFIFILGVSTVDDIPLVYLLLVPLFWIALRLRPRFVTLAMVIISAVGLTSLFYGHAVPLASQFTLRLFSTEEFLITIAIIFFIIVSLEEDRRLSSNIMRSQVATLENAVARISSESNAKNDFITILAHELRNPLAPVVSAIDYLKLRQGRDAEEMETLSMMESMMGTVRRLLDDLLDISRISEGKLELKKERVDLEAVIKRAILSTDHYRKERHQSLTFRPVKEKLFITGDPVRIEQIFSNLLTNASKYSDSGDSITVILSQKDTLAEIIVSDTGVGIEAKVLEKIFTPFHQVDLGERTKQGLGIGLALVKSFVEMHKGSVRVSSKGIGHGSQFTVLLPLMTGSSSLAPHRTNEAETVFHREHTQDGPNILVVDDNDLAASSMGKLLELRGCRVSYAYDARQAIQMAVNITPDIILLDLGLPDQDGYAAAKIMRARGYRGKIIALTGFSGEEVKEKGREAGFEHYLVKPAGLGDLKRVIPEIS